MQKHIILSADDPQQLASKITNFLQENKNYKLKGGPYSAGESHNQLLELKQQNLLLG